MTTVALIGADGAGKTTLARDLEESNELPIRYLYMGVSPESSNRLLPTTRAVRGLRRVLGIGGDAGGPPDPRKNGARRRGGLARSARRALALTNRVAEEWYRAFVARRLERKGYLVLFDRHFYADYWAHDVAGEGRTLGQRVHGRLLARLPRPDRMILLDAPADVLYARKAEGTLELLEGRRREYLRLLDSDARCLVVDASLPRPEVRAAVLAILRRLHEGKEVE